MAPRDDVRQALESAVGSVGPSSWGEARATLFGGSTRRTAEAAGVSERSVQRWIAGEEGRAAQARRPHPARLGGVGRRVTLERIRDGAPVSYSFGGELELTAGGKRRRAGRRATQGRDTGGFVQMDPEGARAWAETELSDAPDRQALDDLSGAMFGGDSDYPIPPSPDYPAIARIMRFQLRVG